MKVKIYDNKNKKEKQITNPEEALVELIKIINSAKNIKAIINLGKNEIELVDIENKKSKKIPLSTQLEGSDNITKTVDMFYELKFFIEYHNQYVNTSDEFIPKIEVGLFWR